VSAQLRVKGSSFSFEEVQKSPEITFRTDGRPALAGLDQAEQKRCGIQDLSRRMRELFSFSTRCGTFDLIGTSGRSVGYER